jgi:hypothetical protein
MSTQFPIFKTRPGFKERGLPRISRLPNRARTLVKWAQPYRRRNPDDDLLWLLHDLDSVDKHKLLAVVTIVPEGGEIEVTVGKKGEYEWSLDALMGPGALKDNTDIAKVTITPHNPKMKVNLQIPFAIAFSKTGEPDSRLYPLEGVRLMMKRTEQVIDRFERAWAKF